MATAATRALCSTCGKENGQVTCAGCSKVFCLNDFNGHRQELGKQLEEIEVTRDLFRQTLTEKIAEPQNHGLIKQIDEWETESINKIRQAAEEARRILLQHTAELNSKIENKLNQLTNQLRQSREKNEFSEPDLGEWTKELTQMKNELENPPNVTIRQDRTALVTTIAVDIFNERDNMKQRRTTQAVVQNVNVPCSFCDEKFTSQKAMADHLMMCGNKTDQCPNCRKYIRRAVSAYHYENNCANPDESTTDDNTHPMAQHSEKPWMIFTCRYCEQRCDRANAEAHNKKCFRNPANRLNNQRSPFEEHFIRNSGRPHQSKDSDDNVRIPCEHCNEEIPWHLYENHMETCREREHTRLEEKARRASQNTVPTNAFTNLTINTPPATGFVQCKFCEKSMASNGIRYHELVCVKNPLRKKN